MTSSSLSISPPLNGNSHGDEVDSLLAEFGVDSSERSPKRQKTEHNAVTLSESRRCRLAGLVNKEILAEKTRLKEAEENNLRNLREKERLTPLLNESHEQKRILLKEVANSKDYLIHLGKEITEFADKAKNCIDLMASMDETISEPAQKEYDNHRLDIDKRKLNYQKIQGLIEKNKGFISQISEQIIKLEERITQIERKLIATRDSITKYAAEVNEDNAIFSLLSNHVDKRALTFPAFAEKPSHKRKLEVMTEAVSSSSSSSSSSGSVFSPLAAVAQAAAAAEVMRVPDQSRADPMMDVDNDHSAVHALIAFATQASSSSQSSSPILSEAVVPIVNMTFKADVEFFPITQVPRLDQSVIDQIKQTPNYEGSLHQLVIEYDPFDKEALRNFNSKLKKMDAELLKNKDLINEKRGNNEINWTAFEIALYFKVNLQMVMALLKYKPQLSRMINGWGSLPLIAVNGDADIVLTKDERTVKLSNQVLLIRLLEKMILDILSAQYAAVGALHVATYRNSEEIMRILMNKGFSEDNLDSMGLAAVHYACINPDARALVILLENYKNSVKCHDSKGRIPLMYACLFGFLEHVVLLINKDPHCIACKDKDTHHALTYAESFEPQSDNERVRKEKIIRLLKEHIQKYKLNLPVTSKIIPSPALIHARHLANNYLSNITRKSYNPPKQQEMASSFAAASSSLSSN